MADTISIRAIELCEQVRLRDRRETLGWLLGLRFGPLPAEAAERLEAADLADLDRWFARLDSCGGWDDVFG